jgi:hypothetical protein
VARGCEQRPLSRASTVYSGSPAALSQHLLPAPDEPIVAVILPFFPIAPIVARNFERSAATAYAPVATALAHFAPAATSAGSSRHPQRCGPRSCPPSWPCMSWRQRVPGRGCLGVSFRQCCMKSLWQSGLLWNRCPVCRGIRKTLPRRSRLPYDLWSRATELAGVRHRQGSRHPKLVAVMSQTRAPGCRQDRVVAPTGNPTQRFFRALARSSIE